MRTLFKKFCNKETILYLVFGVLTTAVDYIVYILLRDVVHYMVNTVISWLAAVIFAFITNKLFVFESKDFSLPVLMKEIIAFFGARVASLLFTGIFMWLTVDLLSWNDLLAKILSSGFVIIMNYFFSKLFIFKKKEEQ